MTVIRSDDVIESVRLGIHGSDYGANPRFC